MRFGDKDDARPHLDSTRHAEREKLHDTSSTFSRRLERQPIRQAAPPVGFRTLLLINASLVLLVSGVYLRRRRTLKLSGYLIRSEETLYLIATIRPSRRTDSTRYTC